MHRALEDVVVDNELPYLLDDMLLDLAREGKITAETALSRAQDVRTLKSKLEGLA